MNSQSILREEARIKRMKRAQERIRLRLVAVEMTAEGHTLTEIAERLRVSRNTVAHLVAEHRERHL